MKKFITILSTLLVVQLALFVILSTREEPTATFQPTEALVNADLTKVDRIDIEEKDNKKLTLVKKDGHWVLPEHFDFPVAEAKISSFTKAIADFKRSWPVGRTDIAAKQFNVVDDKFERRISLYTGDSKVKTLYFGSSPSFRKLHARVDGDKETYAVAFNAYEAPTAAKEWLDKKYLTLERTKVREIQLGQVALENKGGDFVVKDTPEGKDSDATKISPLVTKALAVDFEEVLGRKESVPTTGEKTLSYTLVNDSGEATEYSFFAQTPAAATTDNSSSPDKAPDAASKEGDSLVLVTSKHPYAFKVKKTKVTELAAVSREALLKDKVASEAPAQGTSEAGSTEAGSAGDGAKDKGTTDGANTQSSNAADDGALVNVPGE